MNFKGTVSEKNVKAAFAGESQARNKYTYFAAQARKEGNEEIAVLFEKMADNEKEHAKIWFKLLNDGFGDTEENLQAAAAGENQEWKSMYPDFAKQARLDGLDMLAMMFEKVAAIENDHEKKFLEAYLLLKQADTEMPLPVKKVAKYRCMFCGNIEETRADLCPVCEAIGSYESVMVTV